MKKILLTLCCWSLLISLHAQQQTVSGKVTDKTDNSALPGVSIIVKGTTRGTTTDGSGNFSFTVNEGDVLTFSFIGFESVEIPVATQTQLNVSMNPSISTLDEIVVIGYGEREKKDVTGAISTIDSKEISKSVSQSPELSMQGRMAGVFVSSPGGSPTARPTVRIRGVGSFNNSEPLYVVDGVPIFEFGTGVGGGVVSDVRGNVNILSLINPNDIESITVLKDASSAAIYGVRAANGVVLITTKRGKTGKPKVDFSASRGVQNVPKKFKVLDTNGFVSLYQEMFANDLQYRRFQAPQADPNATPNAASIYFDPNDPAYLGNNPTTDWQTPLINENAVIEDYSLRVSGATDATNYSISGGYSRTESTLIGNSLERYSLSTNVSSKISKLFEVGITNRIAYSKAQDVTANDLGGHSGIAPWQPIYDANGNYQKTSNRVYTPNEAFDLSLAQPGPKYNMTSTLLYGPETSTNTFAYMDLNNTEYNIIRDIGTAYIQINPIDGLKIKGNLSVDWTYNFRRDFTNFAAFDYEESQRNPYDNQTGDELGSYGERHTRNTSIIKEVSIDYTKIFGRHSLNLLLNGSDQKMTYEFIGGGSPIPYVERQYWGIRQVQQFNDVGNIRAPYALQGYMARFSYNYNDKYYLDATVRRDGSSNFDKDYRWGTFPSVSAAWRLSSERFFEGLTPIFTDFKIKAGYGELGNQYLQGVGIPRFQYLSTLSLSPDYGLGSANGGNGTGVVTGGAYFDVLPVKNLQWEIAKTLNVGFESILFNKVNFSAEYYIRNTSNILQGVNLPPTSGVAGAQFFNIGSVKNSGFEFQANYTETIGEITFNVGGNLTTTRNRVTSLYRHQPISGDFRLQEGMSMNYIYGYKIGGIFQTADEVATWNAAYDDENGAAQQPGDYWFRDLNGAPLESGQLPAATPDGQVNFYDRTFLGKTIPGFYYGFNAGANYKGFDLSIFFQGQGDVQKVNYARWGGESMSGIGNNQWTSTKNRWTPENHSTTMPRAISGDPNGNTRFSDRWVEDNSFMRLKNIQIGYTVPASFVAKSRAIERARIYVSGTNLATFTKWTGIDPENDFIPPARTVTVGLNLGF